MVFVFTPFTDENVDLARLHSKFKMRSTLYVLPFREWRSAVSHTVTHPATQMFQIPALIVLTIAATRMYRSLINFSSDTYGLLI